MAISVTHTTQSSVVDRNEVGIIGPDEWNAAHTLTGLGTGVETFLSTPSSANLKAAVTDETGSGALVFATSPTLVTPSIGAATGTSLSLTGALSIGDQFSTANGTGAAGQVLGSNGTGFAPSWTNLASGLIAGSGISITGTTAPTIALDGSAWTTYTPTVSAFSGTFTTVSATGRYKQMGKTYHFQITVTVTTKGTAQYVKATLPNSITAAAPTIIVAQETTLGGMFIATAGTAGSTVTWAKYDGTDGLFNGGIYVCSGTIEAQ